jgi:hypothetical protein
MSSYRIYIGEFFYEIEKALRIEILKALFSSSLLV